MFNFESHISKLSNVLYFKGVIEEIGNDKIEHWEMENCELTFYIAKQYKSASLSLQFSIFGFAILQISNVYFEDS